MHFEVSPNVDTATGGSSELATSMTGNVTSGYVSSLAVGVSGTV